MPLLRYVLKPLAKRLGLTVLRLTAAAAATDAAIHKTMFGSGPKKLIILNKETEYIMRKVKSLEESGLLIKPISETIKNETKEQQGGFLRILLATLSASLLAS